MPWSSQPECGDIAYIVYGDVTVDETATIAPGVVLQADPGSRLVIAAGVSIGMGAILHANQGTLAIGAEAVIGASVLIFGSVQIGDRACIGASSTVVHCSLAPGQVVAANTVVQAIEDAALLNGAPLDDAPLDAAPLDAAPLDNPPSPHLPPCQNGTTPAALPAPDRNHVYGLAQFEQLVTSLFPHRQAIAPPLEPERPPPNGAA